MEVEEVEEELEGKAETTPLPFELCLAKLDPLTAPPLCFASCLASRRASFASSFPSMRMSIALVALASAPRHDSCAHRGEEERKGSVKTKFVRYVTYSNNKCNN